MRVAGFGSGANNRGKTILLLYEYRAHKSRVYIP